jgi:hypothetical protein
MMNVRRPSAGGSISWRTSIMRLPCLGSRSARAALGIAAFAAVALAPATADAQTTMTVAPSGRGITEVVLSPAEGTEGAPAVVRIDYGQPHLRGRQLHVGDLVPYDEPWRLGANAATTLTTEVDLVIGGATVPQGTYVLRALPSRTAWTLLVEETPSQSPMGAGQGETPAEVIARIELEYTALEAPLESFTMWLIPSVEPGPPHGELRFAWGTDMLSVDWTTR